MPLREVKRKEVLLSLNRYDSEGFILIPALYRKHFKNRVKILFDSKKNLIALKPSDAPEDFKTSRWRVWCSQFFKEYKVDSQKVEAFWDEKNNYLIAKIKRN